jgi:hypothetical protein
MDENLLILIDKNRKLFPTYVIPGLQRQWIEPDNKILFEKNLRQQAKDWYYRDHKIEYNINSCGYRTKEFNEIDWENSIVIFGDSIVFGIGVDEQDMLSAVIERLTGIPVINLGAPGSSSIFALHNSMLFLQSFPLPKYVVFGWSCHTRFPYYHQNYIKHFGEWDIDESNFVKEWCEDGFNGITHTKMSIKIARELWKNKAQYYEFTFFDSISDAVGCEFIKYIDYARDVIKHDNGFTEGHPGRNTLYSVANKIIKKFNLQIIK